MEHQAGNLVPGRVAELEAEVRETLPRVVRALRTMAPRRLADPLPGPLHTRADAGRMLARVLVFAAQGIEDADAAVMPQWRRLPDLPDLAVGDQVKVLAHDLDLALAASRSHEVWTPDGRAPLVDVLRDVVSTVEEVRRLL